jgi:predicted ArsR family transcriptional regulator
VKTVPTADARPGTSLVERDASTRDQVAGSILTHGPSTAAALAERLGLTAAAIRRHLDLLEEQGLVESREQRVYGHRGRGRPARVFALTDAGRAKFYSAYDDLAIKALGFLKRTVGSSAVEQFAAERFADTEARYAKAIADAEPGVTPAQALAAALSAEGYAASTQPAVAGEQLCQHHCPVAHVAEQFPQICEAETAAFSRVLGVHVQRLATIAHGDGVCTTHIPRSQADQRPSTGSGHVNSAMRPEPATRTRPELGTRTRPELVEGHHLTPTERSSS